MGDARLKRIRAGPHEIAYEERGAADAPAIVTLHGFVVSQRYMAPLARELAPTFRVLSPDLPGFGRSSKPRDALGIDGLADALVAWMDALALPRAHVVGNSMGGQVGAALAQRHPARVDRLVLLGPTTEPGTRTPARQAARLARDMLHEPIALPFLHVPDYLRCGPRRILQTMRHALADRIEERAPHIRAPTLVLRGARDAVVSAEFTRALAARMPDARAEELPRVPHAANYAAPAATAAAIRRFLRSPEGSEREAATSRKDKRRAGN